MNYEKFVEDNSLNYQILDMKFKEEKSWKEIATALNKSITTITQRYRMFGWDLYKCYFRYLKSIAIDVDFKDIIDFYENSYYAVAYLEKTYNEELNLFRGNQPPVFLENVTPLPPYRKLSNRQLLSLEKKIVKARESQNITFADIGKELKITAEKAKWTYNYYYHKKVIKALAIIKTNTNNDLSHYIFDYSYSSRKRWELIVQTYPNLVHELINS